MPDVKVTQTARLDHALELAVTQSWSELMRHVHPELVHIEYRTDNHGTLEFLKVWDSNMRGHWDLICEMWLQPLWSNVVGLRFANDYSSPTFAHAVESATANGALSFLPDHHRLIQVHPPAENEGSGMGATLAPIAAVAGLD